MPHSKITGNVIGFRIQKARKSAGITQLELSNTLDIDYQIDLSPELISKIEAGKRPVRDREVEALCQILKTSPNALFSWKE